MSSPTIVAAWTKLVATHHFVRVDRELMRTATTQPARDEATVRYSRGVDQIMDQLEKLEDGQQLTRITAFLTQRERA